MVKRSKLKRMFVAPEFHTKIKQEASGAGISMIALTKLLAKKDKKKNKGFNFEI